MALEVTPNDCSDFARLVMDAVNGALTNSGISTPDLSPQTCLHGPGAIVDSFSMISLIVDIEDRIRNTYNIEIALTDDEELFAQNGPLATIASLSAHLMAMVERGGR